MTKEHAAEQTAPPDHGAPGAERRGGKASSALRETVIVLVSALVLSLLIKTFLAQAFYIPSGSMQTTLDIGDRVLVNKLAPGPFDVNRGDVVVFVDPGGWLPPTVEEESSPAAEAVQRGLEFIGLLPADSGNHLVKRLIGMPGDHVVCCDPEGRITINGEAIEEPYVIAGAAPSNDPFDVVVPDDHVFVLGDNRPDSKDSRYNPGSPGGGMVPIRNIVGVAFVTIWPVDRWTLLSNPGETFADVPDPS
ncbi:signal peptidase I [Beutenbergia cavernae DSM 12333]|uniref:Signal peptidase I n=1 Tax=Beutenbergia cavernae (strain ATCC BAA-8 / DSM 12333 / CCUG 43141 / JCM 11478 / NBRC 16432 / NCIMB 13614 / HKI 0122) TaxID=471853 RepID=C5BWW6_BEUC1|nr:signal peptidase I [Beutenbergia cavernae]ACQ80782.1 signal peptidase I [Beutenbergia cavernae DSM 12333]